MRSKNDGGGQVRSRDPPTAWHEVSWAERPGCGPDLTQKTVAPWSRPDPHGIEVKDLAGYRINGFVDSFLRAEHAQPGFRISCGERTLRLSSQNEAAYVRRKRLARFNIYA